MRLHPALSPKKTLQEPVDAAHADRHHRLPANPSGIAGSNCCENALPSAAGAGEAGRVDRDFGE